MEASKASERTRSHAASTLAKLKSNTIKTFLEKCFEENPNLMQEAESFLRSKVWQVEGESKSSELRFCRGRTQTQNAFQIELIFELSKESVQQDILWVLHRQGDEVLNRFLQLSCGIDPKRSIKETMDRRERVFKAMTVERHKFCGDILIEYGAFPHCSSPSSSWASLTRFPLQFPFLQLGLFDKVYEENVMEPEPTTVVTHLKIISGQIVLSSVVHMLHRPVCYGILYYVLSI